MLMDIAVSRKAAHSQSRKRCLGWVAQHTPSRPAKKSRDRDGINTKMWSLLVYTQPFC
jgi:hypothetical protein